jgi:hypothetical protein
MRAPAAYIAGPVYDWICFILAAPLSIAVVWLAAQLPWSSRVVTGLGQPRARFELLVAIWTYGHLFSVVFRSHFNRGIFAKHRLRFTLVPAALYVAFAFSPFALVAGFFLNAIWDTYHSSMQNFGLGRIYDAKAGNDPAAHRSLDIWMNHVVYIGPILAGASLLPTLAGLRAFPTVGWEAPDHAFRWISEHRLAIRNAVSVAGAAYAVYYVDALLRMIRSGYRLPIPKVALLLSVGVSSIAVWGFLPPLEAFLISNLFHSLQYFGIVWWTERSNLARTFHTANAPGGRWVTLAIFAVLIAAAGTFHASVQRDSWRWLIPIPLVISLMHFWYDGFVWSVRRREV